ncbi:hypothetical protein KXX11_004378, partial [Aspergillus fumigatus]
EFAAGRAGRRHPLRPHRLPGRRDLECLGPGPARPGRLRRGRRHQRRSHTAHRGAQGRLLDAGQPRHHRHRGLGQHHHLGHGDQLDLERHRGPVLQGDRHPGPLEHLPDRSAGEHLDPALRRTGLRRPVRQCQRPVRPELVQLQLQLPPGADRRL